MDVTFSYRAKGVGGLVRRAGTILSRFGVTASPTERYLREYASITGRYNAHPTLPITASVLARHPAMIATVAEQGVEFAIHGLVHNDHAGLGFEEQHESLGKAKAIFESAGVSCVGFRGPYLRYNAATHEAIRSLGLLYDCSQAVNYDVLPQAIAAGPRADGYRRARELYGALSADEVAVRPRERRGLIDIPVAIPDDEIMVDRLCLDDRAQATAWRNIFERTYARGDLFTVQLHPERIRDCAFALQATLEEARHRQPGVWIATLREIAAWWVQRKQVTLSVQDLGESGYRVHLEGHPDATLLLRGVEAPGATPWFGQDQVTHARGFKVAAGPKPAVGVSPSSPPHLLDFLHEEGFPTERSVERKRFGAYLDVRGDSFTEASVLAELDRACGPLVRLGRWPNNARSALAVTGDIDSITLQDFFFRAVETRRRAGAAVPSVELPALAGAGALRLAPSQHPDGVASGQSWISHGVNQRALRTDGSSRGRGGSQ